MGKDTIQIDAGEQPTKRPGTIVRQVRDGTLSPEDLKPLVLDLQDPAQRHFGDYEVLELLGQGAMGVVYRARQKSLEREVALKLLAVGARGSHDFLERFRKEAQHAARLQHPNIIAIHEIGSTGTINYFSMQLIDGKTLEQRLREQGCIPQEEAARILQILCETVEYAHGLNVLHLDLKPANILEARNGRIFIADFGLSKPLDHALANDTNDISGTPSYMAPEQVEIHRHRLSRATDLYALGAILYELLTGEPPFRSAKVEETLRRVVEEPAPALRKAKPKLSRDLEAICNKCMAKEPDARYANARELAQDLGRFLDGHPISIRRPGFVESLQRWSRKHPVSLGGMLMALLVIIVIAAGLLSTWGEQELEKNGVLDLAEAQASAMLLPDSTPRQRMRKLLGEAAFVNVLGDVRDIGKTAWLDAFQEIYADRGDEQNRRDARMVLAAARTEAAWAPALEKRNTAMSNLQAAYARFNVGENEEDYKAAFALVRKSLQQSKGDPVILAGASVFCRMFPSDAATACDNEAIRAGLLKWEPDNLFVWAVSASLSGDEKTKRERFANQAAYWQSRSLSYRNLEPEYVSRALAEYDAVAPEILKAAGIDNVDPRDLANFLVISNVGVAYMTDMQASFDGLRSYCQGKLERKPDAVLCEKVRRAIANGASNPGETVFLEAFDYGKDEPAYQEVRRRQDWRTRKFHLLEYGEARFESDRRFLGLLTTKGLLAAQQDLFARHGVSLEPPADYQLKK